MYLYRLLDVCRDASPEAMDAAYQRQREIWAAHQRRDSRWRSFVATLRGPNWQEVERAYELLRDPVRRRVYDACLDENARVAQGMPPPP